MKKISWATHKSLFGQIASSTCLVGASAGVVFGVSAATFKIQYFDLSDTAARLQASISNNYYSQQISSQWNMYAKKDATGKVTTEGQEQPYVDNITSDDGKAWWKNTYGESIPKWSDSEPSRQIDISAMKIDSQEKSTPTMEAARKKMGTLIIDGATHSALDRSFNQSLYNGIANFVTNEQNDISAENENVVYYKPSQDSTQEFVNIYRKAAEKTKTLCLAGFNHVTPINALGKQNGSMYKFDDKNIEKTGMLLIDGDISNNQNIASVLFRSDQPAFLTALSTCMYFYNNLEVYHDNFQDISVAAYGGTAIPTVAIYMGGFQRGVEFFNHYILNNKLLKINARNYLFKDPAVEENDYFVEKLLPASKYKEQLKELRDLPNESKGKEEKVKDIIEKLYEEYSIKMIKLGNFGTHFSGSFASGDAIGISKQYLNRGASAIIGVAGPQTLDTVQEVMNQQKSCIVIGVDCAMENSDYQKPFTNPNFKDRSVDADGKKSKQAGSILKFSAVKDMTSVSDKILKLAASGKNWDVTNKTPWTTITSIPSWTKEQEVPQDYLNIVENGDGKTFNVSGFAKNPDGKYSVLSIPTKIVKEGTEKTLHLKAINNGTGSAIKFNDTVLKNITTLKLQAVTDSTERIEFEDKCFQFNEDSTCGFQYIDLSEVPGDKINYDDHNRTVFVNMGKSTKSPARNKGVIKFGHVDSPNAHQSMFEFFFKTGEGESNEGWPIVEADPAKAICSFGFKTCGNIENGLISISWDGWAPLIDCLRHLEGLGHPTMTGETFMQIWKAEVESLNNERWFQDKDPKFFDAVYTSDWKQLCKYDTDSILHKNYSYLMSILGRVLKNTVIVVPREMTVVVDKEGKPSIPKLNQQMTILDWLKNNMYFIV